MSRARLGLYVFARVSLFQNCFELTPAFNQLMVRPLQLFLSPRETYPPVRKVHSWQHVFMYELLFHVVILQASLIFSKSVKILVAADVWHHLTIFIVHA